MKRCVFCGYCKCNMSFISTKILCSECLDIQRFLLKYGHDIIKNCLEINLSSEENN